MVIDQVSVDVSRPVDRRSERALPYGCAIVGIESENLVRHRREQRQVARPPVGQSHAGHDQWLRLGAAPISRQWQGE